MKKALITGITGQDGSYLAEFLLEKATMSTASFAVLRSITESASPIWKATPTSTCITATSAIR